MNVGIWCADFVGNCIHSFSRFAYKVLILFNTGKGFWGGGAECVFCLSLCICTVCCKNVTRCSQACPYEVFNHILKAYLCNNIIVSLSSGHIEVVKLLASHGAEVACKDKKSYTPLHAAASSGMISVVKYLLDLGVDVSSTHKHVVITPLDAARAYDPIGRNRFYVTHNRFLYGTL